MRTSDDALRSVKKHLAVVLGAAPAPLAAARRLRPPTNDLIAEAVAAKSYGVWTGLDENDDPAEALIDTVDDKDGLVRVPMVVNRKRWYVTPPLFRRDSGTGAVEAAATAEDTWSPGLVAGCVLADQGPEGLPQWEFLLGMPRYAFDLAFVTASGAPYRTRCFVGDAADEADDAGIPFADDVVADDAVPESDSWDVRFFHDRGAFTYPVAIVKAAGPAIPSSPSSNWSELVMPLAVYLYPAAAAGTDLEIGVAQLAAERVRALVLSAFSAQAAKPMRIPLFNYDGTSYEQASSQREDYDYLRVVDCSIGVTPEPGQENQVAVVCDLRVAWTVADDHRGSNVADRVEFELEVR